MALLTDLISPATLTGFTRAAFENHESNSDSLNVYLPNQTTPQNSVAIKLEDNGLVDVAEYRSYDAELDFANMGDVDEVVVRMLPLGVKIPISEFDQVSAIGSNESYLLDAVRRAAVRAARAVADRAELERGRVISTGKVAFHKSGRPALEDDFNRSADMDVTAPVLWSDGSANPIFDLQGWTDFYGETNGQAPGAIVGSPRALRALAQAKSLSVKLSDGATRPATPADVQATLDGYGLPPLQTYNRKVRRRNAETKRSELVDVLPGDRVFLLPAAGQSNLGATYWGRTLSSTKANWGIALADQPGIVTGVVENDEPPMITQVVADAIGQPILANPNLVLAAKVL